MKLYNVIQNLLVEAKFDTDGYYKKLVLPNPEKPDQKPIMDFDTFKTIFLADPTLELPENFDVEGASFEDLRKLKPGDYQIFLFKNYLKPKAEELDEIGSSDSRNPQYKYSVEYYRKHFLEDLYRYTDLLSKFPKYKNYLPIEKRDLNKVSPHELEIAILELPREVHDKINRNLVKSTARETRKESKFAHPGSKIIFVGPNYTLTKIEQGGTEGQEAASYYGGYHDPTNGESNWCTSPPNSSHFRTYIAQGPIYNIFANDDKGLVGGRTGLPQERYQIHFPTSQFKDRLNSSIPFDDLLLTDFAELKDIFKTEYAKYLSSSFDPNKFIIEFPTSGYLGKYIKLYGFDEVYKNIPDTIKEFAIRNTGEAIPKIDISFIGRFKNLTEFSLENIDVVLPEATCELKNLSLISLQRIPTEQTLPECIANLPNLMTLNLEKSDSIIIPPRLLDKLSNVDGYPGFYFVV